MAFVLLQDITVIDPNDSDTDEVQVNAESEFCKNDQLNLAVSTEYGTECSNIEYSGQSSFLQSTRPMCDPAALQFPRTKLLTSGCTYQTFHTMHTQASFGQISPIQTISIFIQQLESVLRLRNSWRVIAFSFASVFVSLQWTASDISLPAFLERRFGEDIPIYTVQNIHMMGCMILPPLVGVLTTGVDDFDVILPGIWIMAISPVMLIVSPTVLGACAWQITLTLGQVLWSPRQDSWVASLAPTGMEGLFFAVSCSRALFAPLVS